MRNLVVATHLPVIKHQQLKNDLVAEPHYQRLTATPPDPAPIPIGIERPILHAQIDIDHAKPGCLLHIITVHLKSKIPTEIPGQVLDSQKGIWRTADAWAEGSFLSSMKRISQALEVRRLVDQILGEDPDARIIVAGDFNAEPEEVPVLAICGNVEDTGNGDLATRVLVPIEHTIPNEARYTLFHHGQMLDHMLVTRNLLTHYRGSEIHNEVLHDESLAFATDAKYPSPTTPPSSPPSTSTDPTCDEPATAPPSPPPTQAHNHPLTHRQTAPPAARCAGRWGSHKRQHRRSSHAVTPLE
ncbi:endonuclease/exonuclease/phosphatase family protein [Streptomyces olivochromogenes]|uniref:endonuclease/exonuclease/phosphatase family protein n=1 Tax=Streptomyces olivochromogenes TaxID=1963 RepID=UPI001F3B2BC8|nr:hypothetical protein [Streptomyces olivochromogenes]